MQDKGVSPIDEFFRNKWVRLVLVFDALVLLAILVIFIINATKTSTISFNITPLDATITVNGSGEYTTSGQAYSFIPGTYEVQISHPDLTSKKFTVHLEPNHNTVLTTFLSKDGNFDFYTLRDNLSSFQKLSEIASSNNNHTTDHDTSAESFITDFQKNYQLYTTQLPVTHSEYNSRGDVIKYISIRASQKCSITLCLRATIVNESDKNLVKSLLKEKGFNVEDFEIEY